jgi:hypothetical protein
MLVKNKLTCVSGYWKVKNKHDDKYDKWFKNTLKINCPYVIFGDKESIEHIKSYRGKLPTYYLELNIEDFITYKYKDNMTTHKVHSPSINLNLIWNEKIFMIEKALKINPFSSEFFMWIDMGICIYRNKSPPNISFPNMNKLNNLPKDKFIYSSGCVKDFDDKKFIKGKYYLHHHVCGTSYILHKNIIGKFVELYSKYLNFIDKNDIWTDQVIWTLIYQNNKDFFYKYCHGYGSICENLF